MARFDVSPAQQELSGVVWLEHYGCYSATLAGWVPMGFSYEKTGYRVTVAGKTLKRRAPSIEEAAKNAVAMAKLLSNSLVAALEVVDARKTK